MAGIPSSMRWGGAAAKTPVQKPGWKPSPLGADRLAGWQQPPAGADKPVTGWQQNPPGADIVRPPTAPTAAQTAPTNSATTQAPTANPLDSQYYANVNQHQFDVNNQVGGLNQAQGYATTDLANALAALAKQKPLDELSASQSANKRGALFSTVLGQQLGTIGSNYLTNTVNDQQAYDRATTGRNDQIAALIGGVPLYNDQQAAAAAERASALAASQPAPLPGTTTTTGPPTTVGTSTPPAPPKGSSPATSTFVTNRGALAKSAAVALANKRLAGQPPRNTIGRRFI